MTKRLAIIPARGGSKRLPRKNIQDFCGKPMIIHILDTARKSGLFDCIHVSTEDPEILAVARKHGFEPDFTRPEELADDHTPLMPVLRHVTQTYRQEGQAFDQIWLLMACAPLVEASDLRSAAEAFDQQLQTGKSLIAVTPYAAPIEWAYTQDPNGSLTPVEPGKFAIRSQDLVEKVHDAGLFAALPSAVVLDSTGAGSDAGYLGHVIERHKAIDIDDEAGWQMAETLYRGLHSPNGPDDGKRRLSHAKRRLQVVCDDEFLLRPLKPKDITENYLDGINNPDVRRFLSAPKQTMESLHSFVTANFDASDCLLLGLFHRDRHVGNIRLHDIQWSDGSAFIGIALFDQSVWGKGLGTASLKAATEFAFETLALREIRAGVDQQNTASRRIFEKAGFSKTEDRSIWWSIHKRSI